MNLEIAALLGRFTLNRLQIFGRSGIFLFVSIFQAFVPPFRISRLIKEIEFIGSKSFLIVFITALFTGMVLGIQGYYSLNQFGSEAALGILVALSIIRELGPVFCALMVTGRAGSAIAAEIGIMKITDQFPALEMMAVDPLKYVISPKVLAGIICLPLLTAFFDLVGIAGGYLVGVKLLGVSEGAYLGKMVTAITFTDICGGILKSLCFGLLITWISTFMGFTAEPTTEGVSRATTNTVVLTSLSILVMDYILTSLLL
ncbi:MlaE family lipid ABC transporter permease subunit [Desulfobacula phenolica]|uniref:Phospholipid/cholesterol/gamma-HCH transport system permease protein n=1 Tax=Desulfobacula phenolica TaxID=90732 RepID=A0A1H2GK63_9BACT|nr:MlaE family lipid ABC transporter permease subunit [Desulfobacula phenolica]SDU20000.1 phospholipid/cholesterol/gamma-HCH transport system permease protein [Desulfobacula phenolica]